MAGLKLNQIINVRLKYEWLDEVGLYDLARYQGKQMTISQVLMNAKANGKKLINGIEQGGGHNEKNLYIYFKPNVQSEVSEWIQQHYGKDFKIVNKVVYKTSIKEVTLEEKSINKANTDYILERLIEINIEERSTKTYSQAVRQNLTSNNKEDVNTIGSDDETCVTNNRSIDSPQSFETMTENSDTTKQEKMQIQIVDLQKQMEKMTAEQEKLRRYIDDLEDSLVSLDESEVGTKEYERAHRRVERMIKKAKKRKAPKTSDQNENDAQHNKKRSVPMIILKKKRQ